MRNLLWILFLVSVMEGSTPAQPCTGSFDSVKGSGWLTGGGATRQVTERNYKKFALASDQIVRAENASEIILTLSCVKGKVTVRSGKPFLIPTSPNTPSGGALDSTKLKNGGGNRGEGDFILFPLQINKENIKSVIRPETAIFRWSKPIEKKQTLSLTIVGEEKPFWIQEVDSEPRTFTSDEIRNKLTEIREKRPNAEIQLQISDSASNPDKSVFLLFSSAAEAKLQEELVEFKEEPGADGCISRAEIYFRYELYNEAAEEYEKALKLVPASAVLRQITAFAQDRAGNFRRRDEIISMTSIENNK